METIRNIFNSVWGVFKTMGLNDVIDIIILSYLFYHIMKLIRETRALQLAKGILLLVGSYLIAVVLNLQTIKFLLKICFQWGFLAIIILFQPELRRMLERVGRSKLADLATFRTSELEVETEKIMTAIQAVCDAAVKLASTRTGALIIFERKTKLGEQIATGTLLDCEPSSAVLGNIFVPNTPLHDGAVIIRDGKILAAGCFLPKPAKEELINKQLGSRHRAAIGMSENSDSIVIVVSEETGTISVAENGELTRGYVEDTLKRLLCNRLLPERDGIPTKENTLAGRVRSKWKK
ncbi:MAG: diadenylate cyclase CdaA [Ruminococcus sp.]|nr:diadenylate cyclase CdaA [Ruminococcus sp.]